MRHSRFVLSGLLLALSGCVTGTTPAGEPPLAGEGSWRSVQFETYNGPGRHNPLNKGWADETLARHKTSDSTESFKDGVIMSIHRESVDHCWLPQTQPVWFAAGGKDDPKHWPEGFLWSGDVVLVKDSEILKGGRLQVRYYLSRGSEALQGRKAGPEDMPSHYPDESKAD